jgi:hypothetical protein
MGNKGAGQVKGQVATEVIKTINSTSEEMTRSYRKLLSAQISLSEDINLNP